MTIIRIAQNENGSHDNQTIDGVTPETFPIPEGYAVIPENLGTPETLENYPFGKITWETQNGIPTVTSWKTLPVPEPEEPKEPQYTELQLLGQQVTEMELMLLRGGVINA